MELQVLQMLLQVAPMLHVRDENDLCGVGDQNWIHSNNLDHKQVVQMLGRDNTIYHYRPLCIQGDRVDTIDHLDKFD